MGVFELSFLISISFGNTVAHNGLVEYNELIKSQRTNKCETNLDVLINELLSQKWTEDEKPCLEQILTSISNVKNSTLWATWIWDSMQLPVGQLYGSRYHLGNYDQCLRETGSHNSHPPFRTQYCLVNVAFRPDKLSSQEIDIDSTERYIYSKTNLKQRFNTFTWGVCAPQICQVKSVKRFAKAFLKLSHLSSLQSDVDMTIETCKDSGKSQEVIHAIYVIMISLSITSIPVLLCTLYIAKQPERQPYTYAILIMQCFCIRRNIKDFSGRRENDIETLHGIRFLSTLCIVIAHVLYYFLVITPANGLDFEEDLQNYGLAIVNSVIAVETFFVMSGLLFMRRTKSNYTCRNLVEQMIKRYFRPIWWYWILIILFVLLDILSRYDCGPLCWKFLEPEKEACSRTWWWGILMLGNYIDTSNMCLPHFWYVFCDFHFTVVAAILYWLYQRHRRIGLVCFTILTVLSVILPGFVTYNTPELQEHPMHFDLYKTTRNFSTNSIIMEIYMKSHYRASPYMVGLIMGYIISKYESKSFRRTITKKQFNTGLVLFVFVIGLILIFWKNMYGDLKSALFMSLHSPILAIIICILIGICEYGHFPLVQDFLSWPIFVPLGKLTYGICMTNFVSIINILATTRSALTFNVFIMLEKFLGNLMLSGLISFYVLLFVEAPLNNLVKLLLANRDNIRKSLNCVSVPTSKSKQS